MVRLSEQQIIEQLAERLTGLHSEVPADTVTRVVRQEHARFDEALRSEPSSSSDV
jgi:hypothetical protein